MPKPTKGARLGGSAAHQRHIIANLCKALIEHKSITTTETRAKAVQPHIEKLITKAKRGDTHNRRQALRVLNDRESAYVLFEELAPLFKDRDGGYTRITKIGNRKGDNAPMAVIEIITEAVKPAAKPAKAEKPTKAEKPAEEPKVEETAEVEETEAVEEIAAQAEVEETEAEKA